MSASGCNTSVLANSSSFSRNCIRTRRSLSSHEAFSWIACARRDERILRSTTSSPISSRLSASIRTRAVAVGGTSAFFHACAVPWAQAAPLRSKSIMASRRSCMSRELPPACVSSDSRLRTASAMGSMQACARVTNCSRA
jgi:hypothetical protein